MFATQKQVIESFVRIRAFLEAHPASGVLTYRGAQEMFYDVIERLWAHASTQVSGHALGRAELRREKQLLTRLRDRHMRPIVTIARAQVDPGSDVGLPVAFRMPKVRLGVTKMLQAADAMMEMAKQIEAVLIDNGMPTDFLARFASDRDELARTFARRAMRTQSHIVAGQGLQAELRRGRLAVNRLDAVVRVAFEGDASVLSAWRTAKRVHQLPGNSVAQGTAEDEAHGPATELRLAA